MTKWGAKARVVREAECCDDLRYYDIHSDRWGIQRVNMLRSRCHHHEAVRLLQASILALALIKQIGLAGREKVHCKCELNLSPTCKVAAATLGRPTSWTSREQLRSVSTYSEAFVFKKRIVDKGRKDHLEGAATRA